MASEEVLEPLDSIMAPAEDEAEPDPSVGNPPAVERTPTTQMAFNALFYRRYCC